jgi:hypothetical protein
MGRTCSTNGKDEKYIILLGKSEGTRPLGMTGKILLKLSLRN